MKEGYERLNQDQDSGPNIYYMAECFGDLIRSKAIDPLASLEYEAFMDYLRDRSNKAK